MSAAKWLLLAAGYVGALFFAVAATGVLWGMAAAARVRRKWTATKRRNDETTRGETERGGGS